MKTGRFCNNCDSIHYHTLEKTGKDLAKYTCLECKKQTVTKANGRLINN